MVLACRVMQPELDALSREEDGVQVHYLDQALHRTPQQMPSILQEKIDQSAGYDGNIILSYGLCSNGIVGVTAPSQGLIVPRAHDCIALFLGSLETYKKAFKARPGTYYLTPGWIAERKDPLGIVEEEYTPRLGRETAVWVMGEELKHYTHITLINTGIRELEPLRKRARENAKFLNKKYDEIEGSPAYLKKILFGPRSEKDFFFIRPGEKVTQEMFLTDI